MTKRKARKRTRVMMPKAMSPDDPARKYIMRDTRALKENIMRAPGYGRDFVDGHPYNAHTHEGYVARFSNLKAAAATVIEASKISRDKSAYYVKHDRTDEVWDWSDCMNEIGAGRRVA